MLADEAAALALTASWYGATAADLDDAAAEGAQIIARLAQPLLAAASDMGIDLPGGTGGLDDAEVDVANASVAERAARAPGTTGGATQVMPFAAARSRDESGLRAGLQPRLLRPRAGL